MVFRNWFGGGGAAADEIATASATGPFLDGATLMAGQSWKSDDGRTCLTLDRAGKLHLSIDGKSVWKPPVTQRAKKLLFDGRGLLSLYDHDSHRLWSAGLIGPSNAQLHLQDDGNLVIYSERRAVWNTGTHV